MRKLSCFLFPLIAFSGYSQIEFKPIKNTEAFKKEFASQSQKVTSIKSDFTQEKSLSMISEKIISKGEFWFKRKDKVKIVYNSPFSYLMIINGNQMISKDGSKASRVDASSNKMFKQINKVIVDCVQGTILSNKDFESRVFESNDQYLLKLSPQIKVMKEFFSSINVTVEKKDYSVAVIELIEQEGDKTVMKFSNKQINATINDEIFTLR
jgi:outer membrane lipoprotein-sorting protein